MISRRSMVRATLAGIPTGTAGGLLMRSFIASEASIHFLGRSETMVALLDTGTTRAMILLGEPDVSILDNTPQLLPFGRSRIDLLIGTHRWLTIKGLRTVFDLHMIATLSLQADASLPPIRGNVVTITDGQLLTLGDGCKLSIALSATSTESLDHPGTLITIIYRNTVIVLASSARALNRHMRRAALLAIPGTVDAETVNSQQPALFVGTDLVDDYGQPALQAHASDTVSLTIGNGSIAHRGNQFSS